jgi:hypothetical protein
MFCFFLAWFAGVAIRFLFTWAFTSGFTIKSNLAQMIVSVVVGGVVAFLLKSINFSGWFAYAFIAAAGFMSKYGIEWLNKKKG